MNCNTLRAKNVELAVSVTELGVGTYALGGRVGGGKRKRLGAMTLAALILSGCMGWVPGEQSYWDQRIRKLCEKDGGIVVLERVRISADDVRRGVLPMTADGRLSVTTKTLAHSQAPIYAVDKVNYLNERNPRVTRVETTIVRSGDEAIVARQVRYFRFGGDMPTGMSEATSYSCPDSQRLTTELHQKLFSIEGGQ